MRKNKVKKILLISLVVLLAVGTLGMSLAFFGKDDFTWVKNKVEDAFVQEEETKENVNLISNSNFKINTSGVTEFTQANVTKYKDPFVDDWYSMHGDCDNFLVIPVDNGLYIKVDESASQHLDISQNMKSSEGFLGETFTVSFSVDDVVYSKTFVLELTATEYRLSTGSLLATITKHAGTHTSLTIQVKAGFEGTVNWVQVEKGDVFTGYVAPTTDAVA